MLKLIQQESLYQHAPSCNRTSAIMETPSLQLDVNQEQQTLDQEDVIVPDAHHDGNTANSSQIHDGSHISSANQPRGYPNDIQLVSSMLQCIVSSPEASLIPWTLEEESRLLPWLSAYQDLDWPEKVKEYLCQFGIFRSVREIHRKVRQLENRELRRTRRAHQRQDQRSDAPIFPRPILDGPNVGISPQLQMTTPESVRSFVRAPRYTAANDVRTERDHDIQSEPYHAASSQTQPLSLVFLPVQPVSVPRIRERHLAIRDLCSTEASNTQPGKCTDSQGQPRLSPSELSALPVECLNQRGTETRYIRPYRKRD